MLHEVLLRLLQSLLLANFVRGAIMFVDKFDNGGRTSTKNYYSIIEESDSAPFDTSKSTIEWADLDPRKQTVGSSYSVIETSDTSTGPRKFAYTKREYNPASENWSEEQQPAKPSRSKLRRGRNDSPENRFEDKPKREKGRIKFPRAQSKPVTERWFDEDSGRKNDEFEDRRRYEDRDGRKSEVELVKKRPKKQKSQVRKKKPKDHEWSAIEEEPSPPLLGAGSGALVAKSGDLKKSGSYLGGDDSYEEGYDAEKHYDKEGGKKYAEAHKSEAGDEAHKGYKKQEAFDAAEQDKHDKEEKKEELAHKQGLKKGHLEQEKQYGEGYEGKAGEKGVSVTKKGGHKKGHKKSGFHKVHHKDEYKKDEVFYDEDHDLDEREEHAHEQEKHAKEKGGEAKKAVVDSQYHEGHGEKKGLLDKGHRFQEASGHKKEKGEEAHHDSHSEFDKKGGVKEGEKHGHVEGGGKKGGYSGHDYF